jgi:hypothetical protein
VFERFTPNARQVFVLAAEEARAGGQQRIGTEHLRRPTGRPLPRLTNDW